MEDLTKHHDCQLDKFMHALMQIFGYIGFIARSSGHAISDLTMSESLGFF